VFAKMVLPKLGGSPSVWAVSMCFFQAVLLAGYCYAHALNKFAPPKIAPLIHLGVLAVAYLALPFGLPAGAEPPPGDAYLWLIGVLGLGVGLPFFAVSANAPLLQSWFARSGHPHAADPYFLYGASNLGSLLALLAYPVVIEPMFGLSMQASVWTGGFIILALMISGSALAMLVAARANGVAIAAAPAAEAPAAASLKTSERVWWIWLSFVPSGLLVAFTNHLTTNVVSAPFLWVLPLAVFLATFILVFKDKPAIPHMALLIAQPILVGMTMIAMSTPFVAVGKIMGIAGPVLFLVTTLVCHRELYLARPASRHLTEFYLWMSFGGVLGGVFAALIAPQVFTLVLEYPLLLVLGLICRRGFFAPVIASPQLKTGLIALAIGLGVLWVATSSTALTAKPAIDTLGLVMQLTLLTMIVVWRRYPRRQLAMAAALMTCLVALPEKSPPVHVARSFFGVHRVIDSDHGRFRFIMHGTTSHGVEQMFDRDGRPTPMPELVACYHKGGPLSSAVGWAREARADKAQPFRAAVAGLGAGVMACNSQQGEVWRFFEIDPVVSAIAADSKLFSFMTKCQPNGAVILGDARLTLAKEPKAALDFLHIDAFASDSVPVHLLTVEAIQMYLDRLKPEGLLVLHISNKNLDLDDVAASTAKAVPGVHVARVIHRPTHARPPEVGGSDVVFVSRSKATVDRVLAQPEARLIAKGTVAPWTDDYSDVISSILRKWRRS
jgi:spermidine synthase